MMTKGETISEIMQLNPSVGATFLSEFNNDQLVRYLRRLRDLREKPMWSAAAFLKRIGTSPGAGRGPALQSA